MLITSMKLIVLQIVSLCWVVIYFDLLAAPTRCFSNNLSCGHRKTICVEGFCRCDRKFIGNGDYCRGKKYSYTRYWSGATLQWRLIGGGGGGGGDIIEERSMLFASKKTAREKPQLQATSIPISVLRK